MQLNEMLDQRRAVILDYLYEQTNGIVQHGLFQGMKILKKSKWGDGDLGGKLLGIYENEIYSYIEKELKNNHDLIINYGCAEGTYGIGIARLVPDVKVIMLDIDETSLNIAKENILANSVSNIEVSNRCNDRQYLESLLAGAKNPFIIMDCECYEDYMLDLEAIPSLRKTTVIVEMHDCFKPGLTDNLVYKFNDTHELEGISQGTKNLHVEPILNLSDTDKWIIANENRPITMHWVYMVPKTINNPESDAVK